MVSGSGKRVNHALNWVPHLAARGRWWARGGWPGPSGHQEAEGDQPPNRTTHIWAIMVMIGPHA